MNDITSEIQEECQDNEKKLIDQSNEKKKKFPELIDAPKRKVFLLLSIAIIAPPPFLWRYKIWPDLIIAMCIWSKVYMECSFAQTPQ